MYIYIERETINNYSPCNTQTLQTLQPPNCNASGRRWPRPAIGNGRPARRRRFRQGSVQGFYCLTHFIGFVEVCSLGCYSVVVSGFKGVFLEHKFVEGLLRLGLGYDRGHIYPPCWFTLFVAQCRISCSFTLMFLKELVWRVALGGTSDVDQCTVIELRFRLRAPGLQASDQFRQSRCVSHLATQQHLVTSRSKLGPSTPSRKTLKHEP